MKRVLFGLVLSGILACAATAADWTLDGTNYTTLNSVLNADGFLSGDTIQVTTNTTEVTNKAFTGDISFTLNSGDASTYTVGGYESSKTYLAQTGKSTTLSITGNNGVSFQNFSKVIKCQSYGGVINAVNASIEGVSFLGNSSRSTSDASTYAYGGAVYVSGTLALKDVYFSGNTAHSESSSGTYCASGGAAAYSKGDMTVSGTSTFINNRISSEKSGDSSHNQTIGGALYTETSTTGSLTIGLVGSVDTILFRGNICNPTDRTGSQGGGLGGAVGTNEGNVVITAELGDSIVFEKNSVISPHARAMGGAIAAGRQAKFIGIPDQSSVTLTGNSTNKIQILNNSVHNQTNGSACGGGVYARGYITTSNTLFSGNSSNVDLDAVKDTTTLNAMGGAIASPSGIIAITGGNEFRGNYARFNGSGYIVQTVDSSSTTNYAYASGGAIGVDKEVDVVISGTNIFESNYAVSTADRASGGAIGGKMNGVAQDVEYSDVLLSGNNTFTNNYAQSVTLARGGAIFTPRNVTFSGADSTATFSGNKTGVMTWNGTAYDTVWTNNDVWAEGSVTFTDAGTYTFGGGIVTPTLNITDSNITLGAESISTTTNLTSTGNGELNVSGTLNIEKGGVSSVSDLNLSNGTLNVSLGAYNKEQAVFDTRFKFTSGTSLTGNGGKIYLSADANTMANKQTLFASDTDFTGTNTGLVNMSYIFANSGTATPDNLYYVVRSTEGLKLQWVLASELSASGAAVFVDENGVPTVKTTLSEAVGSQATEEVILVGNPTASEQAAEVGAGEKLTIHSNNTKTERTVTGSANTPTITVGTGTAEMKTELTLAGVNITSAGSQVIASDSIGTLSVNLNNSDLSGATTTAEHGGLIATQGDLVLTGSGKLSGGVATKGGGAAYSAGKMTIVGSGLVFSGNDPDYGGANNAASFDLTGDVDYQNNRADISGGALYQSDASQIVKIGGGTVETDIEFTGNIATTSGGAIYAKGGVEITSNATYATTVTFSGNQQGTEGNYTANDILSEKYVSIDGTNTTVTFGGGIVAPSLNIAGATVTFDAGSVSNIAGTTTLNNPTSATFNGTFTTGTMEFLNVDMSAKSVGTATATTVIAGAGSTLTNAMVTDLEAGTLVMQGAATISGNLDIGTGTLQNLTVAKGATTNVTGTVALGATSTTLLNIASTNMTAATAVLNSDGQITFDNAAEVDIELSFVVSPVVDQKYYLFTSDTGITQPADFSKFSLLKNGTEVVSTLYSLAWEGNSLVLNTAKDPNYTPEPASWMLLLLGLAGWIRLRKK